MSQIVPTVLAHDPNEYRNYVDRYAPFAKRVQIDISDNNFASFPTMAEDGIWWSNDTTIIDIHMMVAYPSQHLEALIKLRPNLVIFHAEASENLLPSFEQLRASGIKTGVALLRRTFPGAIQPYIEAVDHVLIFAGQLGAQGGTADLMQLEKAPLIHNIKSDVEIGWDGGANLENIRAIAHGGIDVINVGQAISAAPDPATALKELETESDRMGVRI